MELLATVHLRRGLLVPLLPSTVLLINNEKMRTMFLLLELAVCFAAALASSSTQSPIIGVLAQPLSSDSSLLYIAASYIKWIEAGGGMSIAIPSDVTDSDELDNLFEQIDAILLPGGASLERPFAVNYMLDKAVASNENGDYFPVWGTCLGFEYLAQYIADDDKIISDGYTSENISLPLQNVVQAELYASDEILKIVTEENVTMNNHQMGLHPSTFWSSSQLQRVWQITSINHDSRGTAFVSSFEPIANLPFYGVQYHPEKNAFEYGLYPGTNIPYEAINHSEDAVAFSIEMARFAVDLARKTRGHEYNQVERFPPVNQYPQRTGVGFELVFVVPSSKDRPLHRYSSLYEWFHLHSMFQQM